MQLTLEFDQAEHAYTLGGVRIPSVTQVLSHGQDLSRIPPWTAQRGTAFHLATEYDDVGDLDEASVDDLVRPHLDAYRKWRAYRRPQYHATEIKVWGELDGLRFAGTIDRVIVLDVDVMSTRADHVRLMDLKSGAPRKEHGAQLAAYAVAYEQRAENQRVVDRMGVYCLKDGTFSEKPYGREHLEAFRVKLHQWYEANKEEN